MKSKVKDEKSPYQTKNDFYSKIIRPLPAEVNSYDLTMTDLEDYMTRFNRYGMRLELDPEYQRGRVWTREQQISFIENMMRFTIIPDLKFNYPNYIDDVAPCTNGMDPNAVTCIDGLQRFTAVTEFVKEEFAIFGGKVKASDLLSTHWSPKRMFCKIKIYDFTDNNDLLQFYIDLNSGGTIHSESEIERVRKLIKTK